MKILKLFLRAFGDLFIRHLPQLKKRNKFAFLVHPRDASDVMRQYPFLHKLSKRQMHFFLRHFWPVTLSTIQGLRNIQTGEEMIGYVISSPLTAEQMKDDPESAKRSVIQAAKLAERKGAGIIGLGALTASFTKGGLDILPHVKSGVTTGRIYTSRIVVDTIEKAMDQLGRNKEKVTVAVVGAAGSIGTAVAQILVREHFQDLLFLDLERKRERLEWLTSKVKEMNPRVKTEISHDMNDLTKADVVVAVTNAPEVVIRSEHLKPGVIVVDDAQPTDIDIEAIETRNDVLILEGGVAHADHVDTNFNFGLRHKNDLYSCLAETVILAGFGHYQDYSVGAVSDLDFALLDKLQEDAEEVGIHVGELQNVHKFYTDEDFERVRSIL
ncbi:MAG TPA: hypothetical protein VFM02_04725 [Candidatus Paceibacterota bacterium]|nr:hypothetical protein [Candidatus Paceibacterota bacterium]